MLMKTATVNQVLLQILHLCFWGILNMAWFRCASRLERSLQEEEANGADQRSTSRPADVIQCSLSARLFSTVG